MLSILSTGDTSARADAIASALIRAYPEIKARHVVADVLPDLNTQEWPRWDDLLIVVFGDEPLDEPLAELLGHEVTAATTERRDARILPVSTLPDLRRPPPPLDAIKALQCRDGQDSDIEAVVRRVGVLLGFWLRGSGRKFFVSHRQSDGRKVAKQLADYLIDHGYPAWLDADRLDGGQIVQQEIEEHVEGADLLLVLDSPHANDSPWIWKEIAAAIHGFVPIFPLVLRPMGSRSLGSSFLALRELYAHEVEVELRADGLCEQLSDADLDQVLKAIEERLVKIVRYRMKLPANAREAFERVDFDWTTLDRHRQMYEATKSDLGMSITRILSHCSVDGPTFHHAVRAFQSYQPGLTIPGGAPGTTAPRSYNFRLFLYDEPVPEAARVMVAQELRLDEDPLLRILNLTELALYLETFRRPEAA